MTNGATATALAATEVLPLTHAYKFLEENGLTAHATDIRASREQLGSYTTSLRRAKILALLKFHNLLDRFLEETWPTGLICCKPKTSKETREYLRALLKSWRPDCTA